MLLLVAGILLALGGAEAFAREPVSYAKRTVEGVSLHVVSVDLNDPRVVVSPAIAVGGIGRSESFSRFVQRLKPAAAINGTFFDKRSLRPVADIVSEGKLLHFGGMGTGMAFGPEGAVDVVRLPKSRHVDWSAHRSALASGPLLVWEGFAKPRPGGEGFGDPSVFARAAPRSAIGVTEDNRLLLVATARGSSLSRLARAMRSMGAVYAINLDGGSSVGLSYRGRLTISPRRNLTNVLCVYVKPEGTREKPLRPPRGLDWRSGHPPRPVLSFSAGGIRVSAKLPRSWTGRQSVLIDADGELPADHRVQVRLDAQTVGETGALPSTIEVDFDGLTSPKHVLWVGLIDGNGKTLGSAERIFRVRELTW